MKWVVMPQTTLSGIQSYGRVDDDGLIRVTCVAEHPEFQAWLAEGNTPEPWEPEQ